MSIFPEPAINVMCRLLTPVTAYHCLLIANQCGDETNNLVAQAECTGCSHCAQVQTPARVQTFGIRCVYPYSGFQYWNSMFEDPGQAKRLHKKAMGRFYRDA